jgi:hypothetical protein
MMKKVRFIKESKWKYATPTNKIDEFKVGQEVELEDAKAKEAVDAGYAVYINKSDKKESEKVK